MRVLITAVGTRGDVQPALVLARGLLARGHGVRMCTSPAFVETARELGVDA
ncbi:MAG: glycosyltransferase, partial [Myxococcales bacterium]|nr:glycosyltransferase [Myxococcales bacterium]